MTIVIVPEDLRTLTCGQGVCVQTVPSCVSGISQTCEPGTPPPLPSPALLPLAYPDGCPTHPDYFVLPNPVIASADGLLLLPYKGPDLTMGGELNKLAAHIALGRDTVGVHWRSDGIEGLKLGEAVAIGLLNDLRMTCTESFSFTLTTFVGTSGTV